MHLTAPDARPILSMEQNSVSEYWKQDNLFGPHPAASGA